MCASRIIAYIAVAALMVSSRVTLAGQLDDFETASTEPRAPSTGGGDTRRTDDDDDEGGGWVEFFFDVFSELISYGARVSLAHVNGDETSFTDIERREPGAPELPFLRLDLNYQYVESDIDGFDGRIEIGYGPFAFEHRKTRFRESAADDELTLKYVRGLYRVSGSNEFEFDIAFGSIALQRNNHNSGLSTGLVFNIYPHPNFGLRLAPSWSWINGNPINDLDGSVAYIHKYFSLRAGYRRLQSYDELLHGPYAGVSLFY